LKLEFRKIGALTIKLQKKRYMKEKRTSFLKMLKNLYESTEMSLKKSSMGEERCSSGETKLLL
jgi:hypothetical protein